MAGIAKRFFDERWIDAPVRPGKAPGAFAHPTVPSAHPYVLLNYQGKPRDVMTLAHELGHGVHQVLAAPEWRADGADAADAGRNRFGLRRNADLPRAARRTPTNAAQRRAMLAAKVEDMLNTVVRQIAFYSFERKLHHRAPQRRTDRRPDLRPMDERAGRKPRAGDRARRRITRPIWAYIPHFIHSPFYVYAYAFGDCLVNSLYGVYQNARGRLRRAIFRHACRPAARSIIRELLAPFGLDARDPAFWQIGLGMIEGMIDELEAMEG